MRIGLRTWAIAVGVAVLSALATLYATRPAAPAQTANVTFVGRDHPAPAAVSPEPLTADEIHYQVPRDQIRAIDAPAFVAGNKAAFAPAPMPVIGVTDGLQARAYPIPVLSRAEIVNDVIGGRAIAVTW
jgi:hypothetical protein